MTAVRLVSPDGSLYDHSLSGVFSGLAGKSSAPFDRVLFAAAHVVANPLVMHDPSSEAPLDWDATLQFRHHLWSLGFGVAEAMDTAQRGSGLSWQSALDLIERSTREARSTPGARLAAGVGTDHLLPGPHSLSAIEAAYLQQCEAVERTGAQLIVMASRALAAAASTPEDYSRIYRRILDQTREPVILHWLGDMFDPALTGYWGSDDVAIAMETCLSIIAERSDKVDGIKISLLDKDMEIAMRRRLPSGVRMYTGDDFNFSSLIAGDEIGYSDALLGIFDPIAPVAAAAFEHHARQDLDGYRALMEPTEALSRMVFSAPTRFYKTGVVLLAYLNGHQTHFSMIGAQQAMRSIPHLCEVFRLADQAGLFVDGDVSAHRMKAILAVNGLEQ